DGGPAERMAVAGGLLAASRHPLAGPARPGAPASTWGTSSTRCPWPWPSWRSDTSLRGS
ncbi:unnamed protein product, partial [Tetraodon nigroviridis]